jgi:cytochrome c2
VSNLSLLDTRVAIKAEAHTAPSPSLEQDAGLSVFRNCFACHSICSWIQLGSVVLLERIA